MGIETPVWAVPTVGWIATSVGIVGASILDRFLDDEETEEADDELLDDGGGLGGGDLGGGDDPLGGGDDSLGGDDLDGLDGDDEFGDLGDMDGLGGEGGGGGAATDELENRLSELENEVATLSSTVSTVRSENEEISATVEDVEEDVRNLLDIYEMVTRGINPFVDETSDFDGNGGDLGLFTDDGDGADETDEALGEEVANADADGFFDEDVVDGADGALDDDLDGDDGLGDDGGDGEVGGASDDAFADLDDEFGDGALDGADEGSAVDADAGGADEPATTDAATTETDMNDEGKSFDELKAEYESGEADWADDGDDAAAAGTDEASVDAASGDGNAAETDPLDDDPFDDPGGATAEEDMAEDLAGGDPAHHGAPADARGKREPEPDPARGQAAREPPEQRQEARGARDQGRHPEREQGGFEFVGPGDLAGSQQQPYLATLPGDYVGDLVVMEWLEFLVTNSDVTDAARAVNYYERIEWVAPEVAERLRAFLSGFGTVDRNLVDKPGTATLGREHHTTSLRYITQLNGTTAHSILLDRWDELTDGSLLGAAGPGNGAAPDAPPGGASRSNGARQSGTDPARTEQSGADPARAEQSGADPARTEQSGADPARTDRAGTDPASRAPSGNGAGANGSSGGWIDGN